ncbi:MAG TPA: universal stress protein [Bacteroidia bacterium]|nr:universal stress protein [Bacteroidia bacterium]
MQVKTTNIRADRTILAITDFSKSSTNAILFAAHLLKDSNLKLKLVNIVENPTDKTPLLISVEDILAKDSEDGLKKQSAEIASAFKNDTLHISTYSLSGKLKKIVPAISPADTIDLIVAGIPSDKHSGKNLHNVPLLFMGQSRHPTLIVPENFTPKPIKSVLILNMSSEPPGKTFDFGFEHIFSQHQPARHIIQINAAKTGPGALASIENTISDEKKDLAILIPSAGDRIDKALLEYRIQDLSPFVTSILNS